MATHDYIISNASGAAVRADLNNALAAIVSNNSNASSPSTTYAYQWWADTTTGQLKLRNSANNAWITIFELDGTMLMENGSASSPGLAFASDLNTGFFRSAADKINFATGGVERLEIGSSAVVFNDGSNDVDFRVESNGNANMLFVDGGNDAVGVGTATPSSYGGAVTLATANTTGNNTFTIAAGTSSNASIHFADGLSGDNAYRGIVKYEHNNNAMAFSTNALERLRIDSSGNLFIGGTTASSADIALNANGTATFAGIVEGSRFTNATNSADPWLKGVNSSGTETFNVNKDGDANFSGDLIIADKIIHQSDTNTAVRFPANDTVSVETAGSERLRVDSSGRLFVNHTADVAPDGYDSKLQLCDNSYQGSSVVLRRDQNNTSGGTLIFAKSRSSSKGGNAIVNDGDDCGSIRWYGNDGADINNEVARIRAEVDGTPGSNDMPGRLRFYTTADGASSPTERMRIDNTGKTILLGTSTNGVLVAETTQGAASNKNIIVGGHSASSIDGGTGCFVVLSNGNVVNTNNSYGSLSDVKLKENIVDASSQWDDIKAVQVRNYNFKESTGQQTHTQLGVVAQEVELVSPGLVSESPDLDADGNDLGTVTKSVNYSVLYMKAVKALQEAISKIETLETKVAALEAG